MRLILEPSDQTTAIRAEYTAINSKGANLQVPAALIHGKTVVITGKWLKVAAVKDENWEEGEVVPIPHQFIADVSRMQKPNADLFTFNQKLTDTTPRFPFWYEWESVAAIPITSFADWRNGLSGNVRKDQKRAANRGIALRSVPFTADLVRGIMGIYDEAPIRQGRPFWHYGKSFDEVTKANATYLERSDFLGAFAGDELVGFVKIVYVDRMACLMQILAKIEHRDKRPMNALIAKAVETVCNRGCSHLTYGRYHYPQGADGVTTFKHRNGFEEILVPRYYVPLTAKGSLALRLRLHHGLRAWMPHSVQRSLRQARARVLSMRQDAENVTNR